MVNCPLQKLPDEMLHVQLVLLFLSFLVQTLNVPAMDLAIQVVVSVRQGHRWCRLNFCRCGRIAKYSLSFSVDNHNLAMKLTIYWQCLPPESGMDMDPILADPILDTAVISFTVPTQKCLRDHTLQHNASFIGRLHRFLGAKVVSMSVGTYCPEKFSYLTVCTIQDGTASGRRICCASGTYAGFPNATEVYDGHQTVFSCQLVSGTTSQFTCGV